MIIFAGVAGSGKSTQAELLAEELGAKYISTGELLRNHADKKIQEKMLTGELISHEHVLRTLDEELPKGNHLNGEYILDGFPRSVKQTEWLIDQVKSGRFKIPAVIHLKASSGVIIPRLLNRHRPDDNMTAIEHRIDEYSKTINSIIGLFKEAGIKVYEINSERSIDEVSRDIANKFNL